MNTKERLKEVFGWIIDGKEVEFMHYSESEWQEYQIHDLVDDVSTIDEDFQKNFKYRIKPKHEWFVGQEVWCACMGKGEILKINEGRKYPLVVSFEFDGHNYTFNGNGYTNSIRTLYPHPIKIVKA